jgi:hypothetical protein
MFILSDAFTYPGTPYYVMRTNGNKLTVTSDISKAYQIDEETKAHNILESIPKSLRKFCWEIIYIDDSENKENINAINNINIYELNNDISIKGLNCDEFLEQTKNTVSQMSKILFDKKQEYKTHKTEYTMLSKLLSETDKELVDIDHFLEFNNFSASKGYKILALRKKLINQRRKIKNSMFIYEQFMSITNVQQISNAISSIDNLGGRQYVPRTDIYEKLKYI